MRSLLERQIRQHLPGIDPAQAPWRDFFAAVVTTYGEFKQDQAFLSHTLEVVSAELTEANEKLRQESETRLASVSRYYQQTLELQQGMIICVRRTSRGFIHTLCRGQLAARLGLHAEDLEGRLVEDVAPPERAAQLNAAYARAWAGEECSLTFTTSDGFELFLLLRPRTAAGVVEEIIASCVEITALKEAERELRAAKERAEAADRAKSEFLAVMSHEIRTPLNAVLGFTSLLEQSPLNHDQQTWVNTIAASGESLLALINDILDFSKIEAGQLALHPEQVALPALLDEIVSMFASRTQAKGIELRLVTAPDLPAAILTDGQRLRQVLVNLVGNAVKFTHHGHVRLSVRIEPPAPSAPPDTCLLHFDVEDTGVGIAPEQRSRLFKPFSQIDSSSTRHYGGTGLGLAICHRLVHLLGGTIDLESTAGAGSRFYFSIRTQPVDLTPRPVLPTPTPPRQPSPLRILVAEDHAQNRTLMRHALESHGYTPDFAENGREAVAAATARPYDLIFMDLQMPEMDGYDAARAIRQLPDRPPLRIVALTANVFPQDLARCHAAGMDGVLTKPISFRELYATLEAVQRGAGLPDPRLA